MFGDNQIWKVFLRILEIDPFLDRLKPHWIGTISELIQHGAWSNILNALRRLEFWH